MRNFMGRASFLLAVAAMIGFGWQLPQAQAAETAQADQADQDGQAQATQPAIKATWLWDTPQIRESGAEILDFLERKGINVVYLQINRDVKPAEYGAFIREAGARGIAVEALDGRASWGLLSGRAGIDAFLGWVETYQAAAAPEERFSGLHVDIEPYAMASWNMEDETLIAQWQKNVSYLARRAGEIGLPLAADLPFWLHQYRSATSDESLSFWMIRKLDAVTILAYRNSAESIAAMAAKELSEAADLGVPATVAVETKGIDEGAAVTFSGKSAAFMDEQLAKASALIDKKHNAFAGIAIHDYHSWIKLN
ncbi:hypothetical protein [Cohnella algarum]|uniref:hypothetical protein n=1 Tax=Cohnella algarum TaxID=2044859 RepID=UPI001967707A|nr:hypothetical protein [Cohnella algarum]MBN2980336.1 hypothetical protein [Cohnella algarum]